MHALSLSAPISEALLEHVTRQARQDQNTRGAQTRSLLSIPAGVTAATCTAEFFVNCNATDAGIPLSERILSMP